MTQLARETRDMIPLPRLPAEGIGARESGSRRRCRKCSVVLRLALLIVVLRLALLRNGNNVYIRRRRRIWHNLFTAIECSLT